MKIFRKIKVVSCITIAILVVIAICISYQYFEQLKEKQRIEKIQELIDLEQSGKQVSQQNNPPKEPNIDINQIIQDSINSSLIAPVFSDVSMINSSTFTAKLNNEEKTYHLIGVADDGDAEGVKAIIERLESITITYDVRKEKDGVLQIYLWSGTNDNLNNMVNIQIIKQKICGTSYKTNSGLSETPNVSYSNSFIAASKQ